MIQQTKRKCMAFLMIILASITANAQKGNNAFQTGIEAGIPYGSFGDFRNAPGIYGKALFGVGNYGQLTFSTGHSAFRSRNNNGDYKARTTIKPLLAGYRYNIHGLYLEPQIGTGIYKLITTEHNGSVTTKITDTKGGFTWAMGGGMTINRIDLGARYQQGYPSGSGVGLFVLHAGYQFFF